MTVLCRQMDRSNNVWFYLLEPADREDRVHPVVHDVKLKLPLQVGYLETNDCPYTSPSANISKVPEYVALP